MLAALGQRDVQRLGGGGGVVEEHLVEIAHPVEQQRIGMLRLDLQILRHHRRDGASVTATLFPIRLRPDPTKAAGPGESAKSARLAGACRGAMTVGSQRGTRPDDQEAPHHREEALAYHSSRGRASSRWWRRRRWPPSAISAWPIRPASRCRSRRSPSDPRPPTTTRTRATLVAVISNGTAVLGLGNLGALASKPVMEGKAVLFKRFADVNSIDIELDTEDPEEFIKAVRLMGPTFGGINLEDIKAPECFIIEQRLKEEMDIPVFHDDQHGTAVICAAGLINALHLSGKKIEECRIVAERGRGRRDRLPRTAQVDGRAARQLHHVRHQGRDLPGPHRRHEPVEIGPCREDRRAQPGRRDEGRRRLPRRLGQGRGDAGDGRAHGAEPGDLRHGQPRPRDHAGRGACRASPMPSSPPAGRTIPTRSTTSSAFPTSSAARSTSMPARSTTR